MSGRIEKHRSRKRTNALVLADRIDRLGFTMSNDASCSRCRSEQTICKAHRDSGKCARCTQHGGPCDLFGPSAFEHKKLLDEENRLEREEEQTRETLRAAANKLDRLQKQRKLLRRRGVEMLRRGVQGAEAMEEFERLEEEQRQLEAAVAAVSSAQAAGPAAWPDAGTIDWSTAAWDAPAVAGESPSTAAGRS